MAEQVSGVRIDLAAFRGDPERPRRNADGRGRVMEVSQGSIPQLGDLVDDEADRCARRSGSFSSLSPTLTKPTGAAMTSAPGLLIPCNTVPIAALPKEIELVLVEAAL
jgi:hypothetical protein